MAFIIRYRVEISKDTSAGALGAVAGAAVGAVGIAGLPLQVSNDVKSGQYILDAEIATTQTLGPSLGTFEITFVDLPGNVTELLVAEAGKELAAGTPLKAEIELGYFDEALDFPRPRPVMVGAVEQVDSHVDMSGRLVTRLRGYERTGWRLRQLGAFSVGMVGSVPASQFVRWITEKSKVEVGTLAGLEAPLENFTLSASDGIEGLGLLARRYEVPLLIADDTVTLGTTIGATATGVTLSSENSLISCEPETLPATKRADKPNGVINSSLASSYRLKSLGQPRLRLGQTVLLAITPKPPSPLRIESISHSFSAREGYTSELVAVVAEAGRPARAETGAAGVAARLHEVVEQSVEKRRAVDVGEISASKLAADGKYLATLNYGQSVPSSAMAPSVDTPVETDTQLHDKPIASPFAFDRCGLLVPVYPKMRALLAHHRHEANDAVVAGFLFGENPRLKPPAGKAGDWWLCLPTGLGPTGLPEGKAANDLTDAAGMRVVQAKGLHIQVGETLAANVGDRPAPPTDASIVIEHQSGTTITIDANGKVEISTKGQDITLSNGAVSMAISGPQVAIK